MSHRKVKIDLRRRLLILGAGASRVIELMGLRLTRHMTISYFGDMGQNSQRKGLGREFQGRERRSSSLGPASEFSRFSPLPGNIW